MRWVLGVRPSAEDVPVLIVEGLETRVEWRDPRAAGAIPLYISHAQQLGDGVEDVTDRLARHAHPNNAKAA